MAIDVTNLSAKALEINIRGKLDANDYTKFVPMAEKHIEQEGSLDLLILASDFAGWTPSALWQDLKFDVKHYRDVNRLALVGKDQSESWMATVSKPFTGAKVKYFTEEDIEGAREWVRH